MSIFRNTKLLLLTFLVLLPLLAILLTVFISVVAVALIFITCSISTFIVVLVTVLHRIIVPPATVVPESISRQSVHASPSRAADCNQPAYQQHFYCKRSKEVGSYSEIVASNYNDLVTGIRSSANSLAVAAYSKRLIPKQVLEDVNTQLPPLRKANTLLLAIQEKIEVNPTSFFTFLNILHSEPSLNYLATILEESASKSRHNHLTS